VSSSILRGSETPGPTLHLILMAATLVAVVLTAGLASVCPFDQLNAVEPLRAGSVDSRVRAIAPVPPTALPAMTLTAPAVVAQDTFPVVLPKAEARPLTVTPQPLFEGPFSYGHSFGGRSLLAYRFSTALQCASSSVASTAATSGTPSC